MQIYGPFRLSTTQATSSASQVSGPSAGKPSRINSAETTPSKPTQVDQLDLSSAAQVSTSTATNRVDAIAGGGEIRVDRVADIRRQIADGTYETPEKLDAALDRFLDELA
ncbi:MAG: flagellar biosynthesis anti-sigma factor FlgM [Planctomycetota bacterium]